MEVYDPLLFLCPLPTLYYVNIYVTLILLTVGFVTLRRMTCNLCENVLQSQ